MAGAPKQPQDRLRSKKKVRTKTLYFITDFDKAAELEDLRKQAGMAGLLGEDAEQARQAQVKELEADLRKSSVKIVIQSMKRSAYEDLLEAHPMTETQKEEFKGRKNATSFNYETYPLALISASVVEPKASPEELEEWFAGDEWTGGEFGQLFTECVAINSSPNLMNLGKE